MNELLKQLQEQRFLHAEAYVRNSAGTLKHLNASELAHLNQMLTGESSDPWRLESASITIPSGSTHELNVLSNPVPVARDIIGHAQDLAANGKISDGAFYLYSRLVLNHFFRDANRRTAVLAALWLLKSHGANLNAVELARQTVGDLRKDVELETLKGKLLAIIEGLPKP